MTDISETIGMMRESGATDEQVEAYRAWAIRKQEQQAQAMATVRASVGGMTPEEERMATALLDTQTADFVISMVFTSRTNRAITAREKRYSRMGQNKRRK